MRVRGRGRRDSYLRPCSLRSLTLLPSSIPLSHPPHRHRFYTHSRRIYTACRSKNGRPPPNPEHTTCLPASYSLSLHIHIRTHSFLFLPCAHHPPSRRILFPIATAAHAALIPLFRYTCMPLLLYNMYHLYTICIHTISKCGVHVYMTLLYGVRVYM